MIQREGPGWRLAIDPARQPYQALIGADNWALELKLAELEQLRAICAEIINQHSSIADQLMAEEQIEICLERDCWWLELKGDKQHWSLRFVLSGAGRGAEGGWDTSASQAFSQALALGGGF